MSKSFCLRLSFKISRTKSSNFIPGPDYVAPGFALIFVVLDMPLSDLSLRTPKKKMATMKRIKMNASDACTSFFEIYVFQVKEKTVLLTRMKKYFCSDAYSLNACFCVNFLLFSVWQHFSPFSVFQRLTQSSSLCQLQLPVLMDPMREGLLIPVSEWTCFLYLLLYQLHYCQPLMNQMLLNTNMIFFFHLFTATRCCRNKRQGKKEDRGLGSSLIRVDQENSILDQRRLQEIKFA